MQKPNQLANSAKKWLARTARFLVLLTPALLLATPTHAAGFWDDFSKFVFNIETGFAIQSLANMLELVLGALFASLYSLGLAMVKGVLDGQNDLLKSEYVSQGWELMLAATNSLLALALAIMAVMIMTGAQNYNIKKALTALISAIIIANLSYQIVHLFVEVGDALKEGIEAGFGGLGISDNPYGDWIKSMDTLFTPKDGGTGTFWDFLSSDPADVLLRTLVSLSTLAIGAYVMIKLAFVLIERAIRLALLIVFAPLIFVIQLFPGAGLEGMSKTWWSDLTKWVLVLPTVFLLLSLASLFKVDGLSNTVGSLIIGTGSNFSNLLLNLAAIALSLAASNAPGMLGIKGAFSESFFTKTATPFAKNAVTLGAQTVALKDPGGWVGKTLDAKDRFFKPTAERIKENREALKDLKGKSEFKRALGSSDNLFTAKQAARKKYFDQNAAVRFGDPAKNSTNLTPLEQDQLESEAGYQSLPAVKAFEANKKIIKERSGKLRDKAADRNLDAEEAGAEFDKKLQLRDNLVSSGVKDTSEIDADILGLALHMQSMAARGGSASVPWKDKANAAFFGPNGAKLVKVGFQAPKSRYTYTAENKRRYESTLGPRGLDLAEFGNLDSSVASAQAEQDRATADVDAADLRIKAANDEIKKNQDAAVAEITSLRTSGEPELASALEELQKNDQLENMVNGPLGVDIAKLTNTALDAFNSVDQSTRTTLADVAKNADPATKRDQIKKLLENTAAVGGSGTVKASDIQALTDVITNSNGAFVQSGGTAHTLLKKGLGDAAIAPRIQAALRTPEKIRDIRTRDLTPATSDKTVAAATLATATGTLAAAQAGLNRIEISVGEHPGYVEKARTPALDASDNPIYATLPEQQQTFVNQASASIAQSTALGIDPDTGMSKAEDKKTIRELVADKLLTQAEVDAEHNLIKEMGLTTGAVRGREDIDIKDPNLWMQLTNSQRRDVMTKIWATNRSLLEGRHGQPPTTPGGRRPKP